MGLVRALDAGAVDLAELSTMWQGADLTILEQLWTGALEKTERSGH